MKKKIKVKKSGTNIFVIDDKAKNKSWDKRGFFTQEEAEKYIENHERPNDLYCIFDKGYEKRTLETLDKKLKELKLEEEDIEVLNLIYLGNYRLSIEKYLKRSIAKSIKKLSENKLIRECYCEIKITKKGERFINK